MVHAVELRQRNWATHEPYFDTIRQALLHGDLLPQDQWAGRVVIGSTVRCSAYDDRDDIHTWTLVMPSDEDEASGKISVLSPLGWELLGTRVGELVEQTALEDEVGKFLVEQISRPPLASSPAPTDQTTP